LSTSCALHAFRTRRSSDLSILKIVMAASSVLELLFVDLMEEGDLKDENSFIYELTRYNVLKGLQSAQDLKGVNDIKTLEALGMRSEEHTSELQSRENLVCR